MLCHVLSYMYAIDKMKISGFVSGILKPWECAHQFNKNGQKQTLPVSLF